MQLPQGRPRRPRGARTIVSAGAPRGEPQCGCMGAREAGTQALERWPQAESPLED